MENQIYDQISSRTGGDIYIGVVGPVLYGKIHIYQAVHGTMVLRIWRIPTSGARTG